ncbi:D-alanyl-D-alanine carboxypeptidase family protein [Rhizosaccharibacter radicis]|uniref:serine-type D-Ala-D-Ala carboxypeptidase n=1 Tax=Rhizosaccharibacter radicis TaxID=2782605 RepID=A0ABT1VYQ3_9PROT|nr:D-alanyl-D-alanine carboxypeptidase [Acetobacteraceae bacterium KSS12]
MAGAGLFLGSGGAASAKPHNRHAAPKKDVAKPGDDDDGDSPTGAAVPAGTSPAETPIGPLDTQARWAFITDLNTGAVLLQKAADERMHPSSLTKMMTAYIVFSMLKEGRLRMDQTLPVSEKAWRMQGSKMFVPLGGQVPVEDLIRGMLIQSGNDACIVLAEGIAGSEAQFVVLMNKEAARLGMTGSQFQNCTGWPDPNHLMTARDVATIATHLIRDFPQYYHFFSEKDYKFNNIAQGNRNVLVDKGLADGLKTGHTDAGGFGLCASSERDGRRVVMALNGMPTSKARIQEGERLLAWAFANFEDVRLVAAGQSIGEIPVWLGTQPTVPATAASDVVLTLPHGWQNRVKVTLDYQSPVAAPVRKSQPVARLLIANGQAAPTEVTLVAAHGVERKSLPARALAVLEHAVSG